MSVTVGNSDLSCLRILCHTDAPTTAPAWQRPLLAAGMTDRRSPDVMKVKVAGKNQSSDVDVPAGATVPQGQFHEKKVGYAVQWQNMM